jgi:hypothetical protein
MKLVIPNQFVTSGFIAAIEYKIGSNLLWVNMKN